VQLATAKARVGATAGELMVINGEIVTVGSWCESIDNADSAATWSGDPRSPQVRFNEGAVGVSIGSETRRCLRLPGRDVPAFASRLPDTRETVLVCVPIERKDRLRPCRIVSAIRRGRHERGHLIVALAADQQNRR
jgi:hypothetical protein